MAIFNNPAMAQAAQSLASIWAPPSGSDLAGYAQAGMTNQQKQQLAQLFASGATPSEQAALTGVQSFGNTPGGFSMTDATNRRGQDIGASTQRYGYDVGASTSLATNAADNERALIEAAMRQATDPVSQNAARPGFNPGDWGIAGPEVAPFEGPRGPLSTDQVEARELERLILSGLIDDDMLADNFAGERTPVQAMGEDGPVFMSPGAAVRQGAAPAPSGSEASRKDGIALINGQQIPVTRGPSDLAWVTQDGQQIPNDVPVAQLPQAQGSVDDIGLTGGTTSGIQQQIIATDQTINTANQLLNLIQTNDASQGVVGALRGTAQDVIATGDEVGRFFGGGVAEVAEALRTGAAEQGVGDYFDPSIPAIEMMTNLLAWQYAKSMAGDRVSNEQLRQAREAIGGAGLFANTANSTARLGELIRSLEQQKAGLQQYQPNIGLPSGGPGAGPTPPAPPGPPQPPSPPTGGQSQLPDYTQYDALPSGSRFTDPEGNIREKP